MGGLLAGMGPRGTALALLVLGHVLADFAFQRPWMVEGKHRWRPLIAHTAVVALVHLVTFAVFLTATTFAILVAVALAHLVIDAVKARRRTPGEPSLGLFLGDQALHLVVLLVAWAMLPTAALEASPLIEAADGLPYQAFTLLTTGAVYLSAFVFAGHGGNAIVQAVLPAWEPQEDRQGTEDLQAGRTIGVLERWIVLLLALASQWSAIALVIGAKSIARFEDLKKRPFAEYFLVGTLASVLVAIALGLTIDALV